MYVMISDRWIRPWIPQVRQGTNHEARSDLKSGTAIKFTHLVGRDRQRERPLSSPLLFRLQYMSENVRPRDGNVVSRNSQRARRCLDYKLFAARALLVESESNHKPPSAVTISTPRGTVSSTEMSVFAPSSWICICMKLQMMRGRECIIPGCHEPLMMSRGVSFAER